MPSPTKDSPILWIDTETTGLSPEDGDLLEVAAIVTTGPDYAPVDDGIVVTIHPQRHAHLPPAEAVAAIKSTCSPVVRQMHEDNGLFDQIASGQCISLSEADTLVHGYLASHVGPREAILGGNSITLDRNFLEVFAPKTFGHLHYRSLDCTSVFEWARRLPWVGDDLRLKAEPVGVTHRAMADVLTSISQARSLGQLLGAPLPV